MKTVDDIKEKVEELEDEIATIDTQLKALDKEGTMKALRELRKIYAERKYMLNWVLG